MVIENSVSGSPMLVMQSFTGGNCTGIQVTMAVQQLGCTMPSGYVVDSAVESPIVTFHRMRTPVLMFGSISVLPIYSLECVPLGISVAWGWENFRIYCPSISLIYGRPAANLVRQRRSQSISRIARRVFHRVMMKEVLQSFTLARHQSAITQTALVRN